MPALPEKGDPVTVAHGLGPGALLGSPCRLRKLALLLGWVFTSLFGAGVLTNFFVDIIIDQTNISITPVGGGLLSLGSFLGPPTPRAIAFLRPLAPWWILPLAAGMRRFPLPGTGEVSGSRLPAVILRSTTHKPWLERPG